MFGIPMRNIATEVMHIIEDEIIKIFNSERDELRTQAKSNMEKIQSENKQTFNKKRKDAPVYNNDDLVAITKTQFSQRSKLKPKLLGPYKITKFMGNERYEVEKVNKHDGPNKTTTSGDNMKKWPTINPIQKDIGETVPQTNLIALQFFWLAHSISIL